MANEEHLKVLRKGVEEWNLWRKKNPSIYPDISNALLWKAELSRINFNYTNLSGADLHEANLRWSTAIEGNLNGANLTRAVLQDTIIDNASLIGANLAGAGLLYSHITNTNLREANFNNASLMWANLSSSNLSGAILRGANLQYTDVSRANLTNADLTKADLRMAHLTYSVLSQSNFSETSVGGTQIGSNDLSEVIGLQTAYHYGPSVLGIETLYKSEGKISERFLRGCGMPDNLITFLPSLIGAEKPLQFYSCFISYNHKDEEFARFLYSQMRDAEMRVWFAPEEIKAGRKLYEQIFSAIQIHDKMLLILSENSMQSEWVKSEIRRARRTEREETRRKLFPIRLVNFEAIQNWECFDVDSGKDLAIEVREYFIPDFSNWKDQDAFKTAFDRLLRDLEADELCDSVA